MCIEDKILYIVIKCGWKEGIKIIFFKEGDVIFDNIFVDIVFVFKDKFYVYFC